MDAATALRHAENHHRSGRLPEARKLYERVLDQAPSHLEALLGLGAIAFQNRDLDQAIQLFGHAAALGGDQVAPFINLANAHMMRNDLAAAETCCRRALVLAPHQASHWALFARILIMRNQRLEAEKAARQALELDDTDADALIQASLLAAMQGDLDGAARALARTVRLHPDNLGGWQARAQILARKGDLDRALAAIDEALLLEPLNPASLATRADLLAHRGEIDAALQTLDEAEALQPGHPGVASLRGRVLLARGQAREAARHLMAAARTQPNDPLILMALGRTWWRLGDTDQARRFTRHLLGLAQVPPGGAALDAAIGLSDAETLAHAGDAGALAAYPAAWAAMEAVRGAATALPEPAALSGLALQLTPGPDPVETLIGLRFLPLLLEAGARISVADRSLAALAGVGWAPAPDARPLGLHRLAALFADRPVPPARPLVVAEDVVAGAAGALAALAPGPRVGLAWPEGDDAWSLAAVLEALPANAQAVALRPAAKDKAPPANLAFTGYERGGVSRLAALVAGLDAVITAPGLAAHLAGLAGRPTAVLLVPDAGWPWPTRGELSRWYPGMRLYRPDPDGKWSAAIQAATAGLFAQQGAQGGRGRDERIQ